MLHVYYCPFCALLGPVRPRAPYSAAGGDAPGVPSSRPPSRSTFSFPTRRTPGALAAAFPGVGTFLTEATRGASLGEPADGLPKAAVATTSAETWPGARPPGLLEGAGPLPGLGSVLSEALALLLPMLFPPPMLLLLVSCFALGWWAAPSMLGTGCGSLILLTAPSLPLLREASWPPLAGRVGPTAAFGADGGGADVAGRRPGAVVSLAEGEDAAASSLEAILARRRATASSSCFLSSSFRFASSRWRARSLSCARCWASFTILSDVIREELAGATPLRPAAVAAAPFLLSSAACISASLLATSEICLSLFSPSAGGVASPNPTSCTAEELTVLDTSTSSCCSSSARFPEARAHSPKNPPLSSSSCILLPAPR